MFFHMKTTLQIDDGIFVRLKEESARQGRTMSELVEAGLRILFRTPRAANTLPKLPSFDCGGARVDVADRDALYEFMGER